MRSTFWGISFLMLLGLAQPALAQPPVPGGGVQRPTVSPYINLLRGSGGGSAALNYYGIVRPEQQNRANASQFQQQLSQTNQNLNALGSADAEPLLVTGKGATFLNYSHYFNNPGGGGGSQGARGSNLGSGASRTPSVGGGAGRSSGFTVGQSPGSSSRGARR